MSPWKIAHRGLRRQILLPAAAVLFSSPLAEAATDFRRGDANMDGWVNLSDAGYLLDALFFRGRPPTCDDAADANDDGTLAVRTVSLDVHYLLDWLYPSPVDPPPPPPAPFPNPGPDPTADALGCADPGVTPPAEPDPGIRMSFEMPATLARGQKGVEVFLEVALGRTPEGLSLACLVDRQSVEIAGVDLRGTLFPEERRAAFEASPYFRVSVVRDLDSPHDVLRVGALFFDGRDRIPLTAPRQAATSGPLLRLLLNVKDTAPLGERMILQTLAPPPGFAGAITELVIGGRSGLPEAPPNGSTRVISAAKIFLRGEVNNDEAVNIADPVAVLSFLFGGRRDLACVAAADANDSTTVNISDPIYLLGFLFLGGPAPPSPHPGCAPDPEPDGLACDNACGSDRP